jgi:hypothetical protein
MGVAFALSVASVAQHVKPGLPLEPPIAPIHQGFILPSEFQGDCLGKLEVNTLGKQVSIQWSFGAPPQFVSESFDLNYWPTAVCRITDDRLRTGRDILVAGKRPSTGTTIIERWQLTLSSPGSPTVVTKSLLSDNNAAGRRVVRTLEPVNGIEGKAFVQFHDSDSLYLIDALTGQLGLVASAADQPKLADDRLKSIMSGRIGTQYVYVYQSDFTFGGDGGALVMRDDNADGMIESWSVLADVNAWEGFFAANTFTEKYMD